MKSCIKLCVLKKILFLIKKIVSLNFNLKNYKYLFHYGVFLRCVE